jgi:hypothetical protein
MKREFPATPDEAFEAAIEDADYADQLARSRISAMCSSADQCSAARRCFQFSPEPKSPARRP